MQARRASSSRASVGISGVKGILVGEDHSVATVIKEKDQEIAELRARLDDKDKMLAALRTAARSRDNADRVDSRAEIRTSQVLDAQPPAAGTGSPPASLIRQVSDLRARTKTVDEMSKMLDEMIQDKVESGHLIRSSRGSVRVAPEKKQPETANAPPIQLQLLSKQRAPFAAEPKSVVLEV